VLTEAELPINQTSVSVLHVLSCRDCCAAVTGMEDVRHIPCVLCLVYSPRASRIVLCCVDW